MTQDEYSWTIDTVANIAPNCTMDMIDIDKSLPEPQGCFVGGRFSATGSVYADWLVGLDATTVSCW